MIVVADRRVLDDGARIAGVPIDIEVVRPGDRLPRGDSGAVLVDVGHLDPATIERGRKPCRRPLCARQLSSRAAAGHRRRCRRRLLHAFQQAGDALAEPSYEDEIGFTAGVLGTSGPATEFNVLDRLWNARVTSHVPLPALASLLTVEGIVDALALTTDALRAAGFEPPRVGVAALNPHAGDGGNFGREEIDIIAPAVERAKAKDFTSKDRIQPTPCSCAPVVANSMRC